MKTERGLEMNQMMLVWGQIIFSNKPTLNIYRILAAYIYIYTYIYITITT